MNVADRNDTREGRAVRIGVNPLLWINDDEPSLGADVPLERCLAEAREAGYSGIEMGHRFPRRPRELAALLGRHGLALVSGWYGARLVERGAEREMESLGPHLALLRAMGCDTVVLGEVSGAVHRERVPVSRRPVLDRAQWSRFARELDALARRARGEGVRIAFHHHVGTVVETPDEIDRLMRDTSEAVSLLLDTGHLAWGAGGPDASGIAARHARRIAHVHLKDVRRGVLARARREGMPFLEAVREGVFTVPGDGALDLERTLAPLARRRYAGWIVVEAEQDPARAHPLTYARLGFANATRLIASSRARARSAPARPPRAVGPARGAHRTARPSVPSARPRPRRPRSGS